MEKRDIFITTADRRLFGGTLVKVARESGVRVLSFCLMGNHYHLLVSVSERPLGEFMQRLLTCYAHYFNQSRHRVGHLFQGRYKAIPCEDPGYLLHLITYIHLNPVRAGFTKSADEWPWSSHEDFMQMSSSIVDFTRLSELTGMQPLEIRDRYIERLAPVEQAATVRRPSPAELLRRAADTNGLDPMQILSGRRGAAYSRAKRQFLQWTKEANYPDVEIADYLGCSPAALSYQRSRTF